MRVRNCPQIIKNKNNIVCTYADNVLTSKADKKKLELGSVTINGSGQAMVAQDAT